MLNPPRRHFLPWHRPLLPQAVTFLADGWTGPDPLDLSRTLVIVPTRQSGRRLREALADFAARRRSAVFAPRVLTPEALVAPVAGGGVASRLEVLLAWVDVLRAVALPDFREVFPIDPPARNLAWALRLAEQLARLQATLRENGLRIADVAERAGSDFPETERWHQLAALEQRQAERLAQAGLRPPMAAIAPDQQPALAGIERIVVVATADPLPALPRLLAAVHVAVDVLVFAPADEAASFDLWGRPAAERWAERRIDVPQFEQRVHLCSDPAEQAARIAALAEAYRDRRAQAAAAGSDIAGVGNRGPGSPSPATTPAPIEGWLGLGIADPDILPLLETEANRGGVAVFNPEGRRRRDGALYHLLLALADCARRPTFAAVERLARCPDLLAYLARCCGREFSAAVFLRELDNVRQRHLPAELADARPHAGPRLVPALTVIADVQAMLARGPFPQAVATVLAEVFGGRGLEPARDADADLQDAATAWTGVMRECAAAAQSFSALAADEWWEIALRLFAESRRADDKPAGALELQGWLELLFEDAPHLVVAGLNDGFVPEAVSEDPFLPESLRVKLGLKTNAARFARDAYILQAVAAARAAEGRLDLLLGKTSASGDPLRPSRLLLRCADDELPARVEFLFRAPDAAESHLPWRRAWRLQPRIVAPPRQVGVTSLKRWLVCPLRFYFQYALKMQALDPVKREMDAFDFGRLCHAAFEAMGRDRVMRDCTDATSLREFLLAELTRAAHAQFGAQLSLPLVIQLESARQRLSKFAEVQARERAAGWQILEIERPIEVELGGVKIVGRVDRIDRHEPSGAIRVVDYKTSDAGTAPAAAHLRSLRADETLPDWVKVVIGDKQRAWADLQLPLYRQALGAAFGPAIGLGYINLPKAVGETALALWDDYTDDLHRAAMTCAAGVCAAIAAGEFWPPNENLRADSDDFAPLLHHGAADSIAWAAGQTSLSTLSRTP